MEFAEYGDSNGELVVYFHGAPGAADECSVFRKFAADKKLRIICFDRFSIDKSVNGEDYYREIADKISSEAKQGAVDLIGFSIGAHVAIEVRELLSCKVRQMHLVSAAAPISAGEFIQDMAGASVFRLARKIPFVFRALTQYQRLIAMLFPSLLVKIMFSTSRGKDSELVKQGSFSEFIEPVLKRCFVDRAQGYIRDVLLYVDWQPHVYTDNGEIYIWHGAEDNWSPLAMADYLYETMPGVRNFEKMEGLSHYSCLFESVPRICNHLSRSSDALQFEESEA